MQTLRTGISTKTSLDLQTECGFTLLEILAVLMLFGVALAMIVPRFGAVDPLGQSSRQFVSLIHTLQAKATSMQKSWNLHLDVDQQTYWAAVVEPDGEQTPTDAALVERITLPPTIRYLEIVTLRQGLFQSGEGYLQVLPTGRIEPGVIHLVDDRQNVVAIQILPVTGQIRLWEQRLEAKPPDPIPERVRQLLQPSGAGNSQPAPQGLPIR